MVEVFSIPAFFIVLREVLEACLVVGIVLAYLDKVGATQYRKWVWIGAAGGIAVSVAVGLGFGIYFFVENEQVFKDNAEKIFEGVAFLVAAALLTWMIIWMMMMGKNLQSNMEKKVESIIDNDESPRRRKTSIFLMVFVQVLREGIETVIFLIGTAKADDVGGWRAIPIPGILAILVGLVISFLVFKGMVNLDIVAFLQLSGFVLMAFAAGLVSHAFHELQEVDAFGPWKPAENRDWYNHAMWSTKGCCNDKTNEFFAMLRALFGYQDTPTFIEWSTYFAYWFIIACIFVVVNWGRIRAERSKTASQTQTFAGLSLLFTFVAFIFVLLNRTWIGILTMTLGFMLSIIAVYAVFDSTSRLLSPLHGIRRTTVLATGVSFALLTVFMFVLHIVQMGCEGSGDCSIDKFFFFGLIYDPDFLERGREESAWPALAALSFSIVLTVFFFGTFSFLLILFAFNVDSDGNYMYDGTIAVKGDDGEEGLQSADLSDEIPPQGDQVFQDAPIAPVQLTS